MKVIYSLEKPLKGWHGRQVDSGLPTETWRVSWGAAVLCVLPELWSWSQCDGAGTAEIKQQMQRGRQRKQKPGAKFWGRMNTGLYCLIPFLRQVNNKLLLVNCCSFSLQYFKDLWRLIIMDCTNRVLMGSLSFSPSPRVDIFTFFSFKVSKIIK